MFNLGVRSLPAFTTTFLLPILLASAPDAMRLRLADVPPSHAGNPVELAQVAIEQRVIIRIPTVRAGPGTQRSSVMREAPPPPPPIRWKETKGPKCLPLNAIRGAMMSMENGVTLFAGRNEQYRPHFSRSCRSADFYAGFYIQPNEDGAICAGRDTLHARNGSACEIEKISRLVPELLDPPERPKRPSKPDR